MLTQSYHFSQANLIMESQGLGFLTLSFFASHGRTQLESFLMLFQHFADYQLQRVGEGGCRWEIALLCLISRLSSCLGSVYCQITTVKMCVHLAAHGRAVNCCIWLPGEKPGSAFLQVVSPMCQWLMHQRPFVLEDLIISLVAFTGLAKEQG